MQRPVVETVIGQQVAKVRKFRGWTQRELADFAGVSHSLLTKVESGHVPASQAFVAACARALRVRVEELTGQPYRGDTTAGDRADAGVAGLRAVLWEHDPERHEALCNRVEVEDLHCCVVAAA
jgi:transcriptional regulator with XRE-family HTH domain